MYLRVHVIPGSKEERVTAEAPDKFTISVKEPAREGLANRRTLQLIAGRFGGMRVRLVSGHHSSHKIVSVD